MRCCCLIYSQDLVTSGSRWIDLKHPNILPFHGIVYDYSFLPAIVCPYFDAGNVLEYIQEKRSSEQKRIDLVSLSHSTALSKSFSSFLTDLWCYKRTDIPSLGWHNTRRSSCGWFILLARFKNSNDICLGECSRRWQWKCCIGRLRPNVYHRP